jgi:hypothetical protein
LEIFSYWMSKKNSSKQKFDFFKVFKSLKKANLLQIGYVCLSVTFIVFGGFKPVWWFDGFIRYFCNQIKSSIDHKLNVLESEKCTFRSKKYNWKGLSHNIKYYANVILSILYFLSSSGYKTILFIDCLVKFKSFHRSKSIFIDFCVSFKWYFH